MQNDLPQPQKSNLSYKWLFGGIICGLTLLGLVIFLFRASHSSLLFSLKNFAKNGSPASLLLHTKQSALPGGIIHVGMEDIYKKDLDYEMKYAPGNDPEKEKFLLNKLIQDSIILQGAEADKLITLDSTFYNSPNKDYTKRIKIMQSIENLVNSKAERISGTVVNIWFYNNDRVTKLGYDKSKALAYQKAIEYHQKVTSNQLTIDQAREAVKTDKSLDQLTIEHKNNSGFAFDIVKGEEGPTFDNNFNNLIWQLNPGQLSPVTVITDYTHPGKPLDALYSFALVKSKTTGSRFAKYEDWLKAKTKDYAVMYY